MSGKSDKDKTKQLQDKCQSVLNALLRDEDNKYCVDCDSKGPRWASWNIGVFLCIRCAGIHRNLGVHISKVKSVNLDSWTPEQVVSLQQMGNSRARAVYEANLPDNFRRPQNDSSLESFIRAKYEHKKYIAREWVPLPPPKVNWEKEIEEEMEKQKRKKKTIFEKKTLANVEVPQLPKPTNPSPKPMRAHNNHTPETKEKQKHNNNSASKDLLGTGINGGVEDSFSNFMSATPISQVETAAVKTADVVDSVKSEEESFFNQTLPVEKEKVKLDKDSILALYGSTPTQFQNPMQVPFQTPTGFQAQGQFPAFGAFPQTPTNFPPNGLNIGQTQFMPTNMAFNNWNKNAVPVQQQFQQPQNQTQFVSNGQFGAGATQFAGTQFPVPTNQMTLNNFQAAPSSNQSTSLFPNQLQQQFGNLTLNGGGANAATPNIWQ